MYKAVFFDRDGTLIRHTPYLHHAEDVELIPTVGPALRLLRSANYRLIVITNQAGIAYGYFTENDLLKINHQVDILLMQQNCKIDAWYYCPHHPKGKLPKYSKVCNCRKPGTGLLLCAAQDYSLDLVHSFTVGDRWSDTQAGVSTNGIGILVLTGEGKHDFLTTTCNRPTFPNLLSAARWIVAKGGSYFAHCL